MLLALNKLRTALPSVQYKTTTHWVRVQTAGVGVQFGRFIIVEGEGGEREGTGHGVWGGEGHECVGHGA